MAGKAWTNEEIAMVLMYLYESEYKGQTITEISRAIEAADALPGRSFNATRRMLEHVITNNISWETLGVDLHKTEPPKQATFQESKDGATAECFTGTIKTVEDLLAYTNVDLTQWEIERKVVNVWEVGMKLPDGTIAKEQLHQIKVWLKRAWYKESLTQFKEEVLKEIASKAPAFGPIVREQGEYLLEVSPFDLHIGKLAWGEETGSESYDSTIACRILEYAIEDLLHKSQFFKPKEILFVIGQDLMHTDGLLQTTTHGTRQDADTRHQRIFRHAWEAMRRAIDRLKLVAPVIVKVVPGNHDQDSAFKLGEVLWACYENDHEVTIDNSATLRKYHKFGNTLLGFTHGCYEKHADLPMIMANEAKAEWSQTQFHEWHVGHLHKKKETRFTAGDTHNGVGVTILPSLSGTDAWHAQMGYVKGPRAAQAFVYSLDGGEVARFTSNYIES